MELVTDAHCTLEEFRNMWDLARRSAAAGSYQDAVLSVTMLLSFLEANACVGGVAPLPGLPAWLLLDIRSALLPTIESGASLDQAFHLKRGRGRSLMEHAERDMHISFLAELITPMERLAEEAPMHGIAAPSEGAVWTADSLRKAIAAHERRIKSGLLFHRHGEDG